VYILRRDVTFICFSVGKIGSLQRQLNLYGFRSTNRIDEMRTFCHPKFIRGQYDLVRTIRRRKLWPTKRRGRDSTAEHTTARPAVAEIGTNAPSRNELVRDGRDGALIPLALSPLFDEVAKLSSLFDEVSKSLIDVDGVAVDDTSAADSEYWEREQLTYYEQLDSLPELD
jgi:hypothetical protein